MSIIELYKNGHSILEISKIFYTTTYKIRKNLVDNNISIRDLSESMINFYRNNPEKHPWKKNGKFISKPCENFKKILKEHNINYVEEYSNFIEHSYSIDVALPEYKIGYEINGNQHYNKDGTLKEYYINREEYLKSKGWQIYQLHYSLCYNKNLIIDIVKRSIDGNKIFDFCYDKYLYDKLNNKKIRKIIKNLKQKSVIVVNLYQIIVRYV